MKSKKVVVISLLILSLLILSKYLYIHIPYTGTKIGNGGVLKNIWGNEKNVPVAPYGFELLQNCLGVYLKLCFVTK